jgi:outer membrane protein
MKKIVTFSFIAVLMLLAGMVNGQKFAHINSQELLSSMPESDSAQAKIESMAQDFEAQLEEMQVELNKKYDDYLNNRDKYTPLIRQTKESEIADMNDRIQQFQAIAQQELEDQRNTLLRPILEKANNAVKAVAEEHDFLYVFDLSLGNPIYFSDESVDILPMVKEKMGIK